MVPVDDRPWPTLGPLVCDWIERNLVFGPGDLWGMPAVLDDEKRLISSLSEDQAERLIESGIASGGMIPKIKCCLGALRGGVPKAHIIDGRVPHALVLEMLTEEGIGTEIVREQAPGV